jgi:type VI secretion system protein ImpI
MNGAPHLILAVQGAQADRFGNRRAQVFDERDGSIGRSEDCDWVLGAEGVSRLHALVRYLNGIYFIEDRSTNGMLLNGAPLSKGDPAALKDGDRLQIDEFEISVRLSGNETGNDTGKRGDGTQRTTQHDNERVVSQRDSAAASADGSASLVGHSEADFAAKRSSFDAALFAGSSRGAAPHAHAGGDALIPGPTDEPVSNAGLDPLALFDAPPSYLDAPAPPPMPEPSWNHAPATADRFDPPQAEPARQIAPVLPEDWDASRIGAIARHDQSRDLRHDEVRSEGHYERRDESRDARRSEGVDERHADSRDDGLDEHLDELEPPHHALDAQHEQAQGDDLPRASDPQPGNLDVPSSSPPPAPLSQPLPQLLQQPVPAAAAQPAAPATDAADPAPDLPAMFELAIDALMDVLRARAELKNSFRMPATLIQRSENNPLKFAPDAGEAVKKLLAPPNSTFLSGTAALNDAVVDIRNHQMAMLAGVRSAFESLLAHFDPARIEQDADANVRRLPIGNRPRHWERYKEQFEILTRNPDECFRSLFGDAFARAYEDQLVRLKNRSNF